MTVIIFSDTKQKTIDYLKFKINVTRAGIAKEAPLMPGLDKLQRCVSGKPRVILLPPPETTNNSQFLPVPAMELTPEQKSLFVLPSGLPPVPPIGRT